MEESKVQDLPRPKVRKVWVLNSWNQPYIEEFQGSKIVVPPNNEKKIHMNYIEARHFLGVTKYPAALRPDGTFEGTPKMLRTEEMSSEETEEITGKTIKDLRSEVKREETEAKSACPICGSGFKNLKGMEIHVARMHPEYEAIEAK